MIPRGISIVQHSYYSAFGNKNCKARRLPDRPLGAIGSVDEKLFDLHFCANVGSTPLTEHYRSPVAIDQEARFGYSPPSSQELRVGPQSLRLPHPSVPAPIMIGSILANLDFTFPQRGDFYMPGISTFTAAVFNFFFPTHHPKIHHHADTP